MNRTFIEIIELINRGKNMLKKIVLVSLFPVLICGSNAVAGEKEDLLLLKNTTIKLLQMMVQKGTITQAEAENLVKEAQEKAKEKVRADKAREMTEPAKSEVKIPFVPEFVKDQIRQQVRSELRSDVTADVLSQAKQERWGVPGVTPEWINRIKLSGDIRLRAQADMYADNEDYGNSTNVYYDYNEANDIGSASSGALINTEIDRERLRARVRLGLKAKITNDVDLKLRLATGSGDDPVSTNQTMGNYGNKYNIFLDRAQFSYTDLDLNDFPWLTVTVGRMSNPFLSTDLLWDSDLAFEGISAKFRYNMSGSDDLFDMDNRNRTLFLNTGIFPIDEFELSSKDKWLVAMQFGGKFIFEETGSILQIGLAYYDFRNITGKRNEVGSSLMDYTAPEFMQKGNSVFQIANNGNDSDAPFALASDFNELNLTAKMTFTHFAPIHVVVTADMVRNMGYDKDKINERTGGAVRVNGGSTTTDIDELTEDIDGYQLMVSAGWPIISQRRSWKLYGGYRYLERDAVLDAFTDSDFHLGGTNAKGYFLGGQYAVLDNVVLSCKYLTADEIDGAPFGVDTFQFDLIAKF